jgi:hypothetical protein
MKRSSLQNGGSNFKGKQKVFEVKHFSLFFPFICDEEKSFETLVPDWRVSTQLQNQNIMSGKT